MEVLTKIKGTTSVEEAGKFRIPFGKYEGRELREAPRSYLGWVLSVERSSQAFRELQDEVRAHLGIVEVKCGPRGRLGSEVGVGLGDRLTREYLAIVRAG